ncbi:hypothetical protein F5Y19DRAFT_412927 [Xylariaceae sp. FL1651]|nr:hypothetical protein F5Y19DRAFT_412927 [Xylariaceae sp. FL1651]
MVDFNTQIAQPNFSDPSSLQYMWAVHNESCLRPTADYQIPIVCQVLKAYGSPTNSSNSLQWGVLPSFGLEFDTFQGCCLTGGNFDGTQWALANPCETEYCFVTNETIAKGFDECIVNAAAAEIKKLNLQNNVSGSLPYRGACEYIDYDSIKKGVRPPDKVSAAMVVVPPHLAVMIALVTAAAMSILISLTL